MNFFRILRGLYYRLAPLIKECAYFSSFGGQYSDNPKYVSLKLHELAPEIKIFWAVSDDCRDVLPEYVTPVRAGSSMADRLRFSCNVVVDNYMGISIPCGPVIFKYIKWMAKNKEQLTVSTWHGTPLKKMGLDDVGSKAKLSKERQLLSDFVVAGCRFTAGVLTKTMQRTPYPTYLTGTPRNDMLCSIDTVDIESLKNRLKLPHDKKIMLFAPTFRDNIEQSGISQVKALDVERILNQCACRFGDDWVFVLRVHNLVLQAIDTAKCETSLIIDGNKGDDMAEYLVCADILLTDYSSSMFDFALTGRPCFLFAPDREHYEKRERGFYLDYDELPFPVAYTGGELLENIKAFDVSSYKENIEKFLAFIGNVEDGRASERIARCIMHFIRTGEKKLETVDRMG
ncbi:MAG: CDP-glycerol glycerophosphotransferase family protein [bacterium]|nr:CDP-glycerol glycerophosphotransferase family protein [bacterium]